MAYRIRADEDEFADGCGFSNMCNAQELHLQSCNVHYQFVVWGGLKIVFLDYLSKKCGAIWAQSNFNQTLLWRILVLPYG